MNLIPLISMIAIGFFKIRVIFGVSRYWHMTRTWNEISYIIPHKPRHARMAAISRSSAPKQRFLPFPSISLTATTKLLSWPYLGAAPCRALSKEFYVRKG